MCSINRWAGYYIILIAFEKFHKIFILQFELELIRNTFHINIGSFLN